MSSLSSTLENYTLAQSLQIHSGTVRCLSLSNDLLLSGGLDTQLFLSKLNQGKYEPLQNYHHHTSYIYSCSFANDGQSFFSGDKSGTIVHSDFTSSNLRNFLGHSNAVCSLDVNENVLLSGSWDATARIWDINTGNCLSVLGNEKHTYGVCVKNTQYAILTASQNGKLNFWSKSGEFIRSIQAHNDLIREISFSEEFGILTCSNDNTIKQFAVDGRLVNTYMGHTGFVFCAKLLRNGEIISGGDDKTVKIWSNGRQIDSIIHPNSIWDVAVNFEDDIITAGADCFIRVFTRDRPRVAAPEEIEEYNKKCTEVPKDETAMELDKMQSINDISNVKGKKEGDVQIFNNFGVPEAYVWHVEGEFWERIGEVVGQGSSAKNPVKKHYDGDRLFKAGEYDYVFDVELGDGVMRKMPYNNADNPLETAERFIAREGMNKDYVSEITKFIMSNAQPTYNSAPKAAPVVRQISNRFFPQQAPIYFDAVNIQPIINKIKEFNASLVAPHQLNEAELRELDRIAQALGNPKDYKQTSLTYKDTDLLLKLINWPRENIFPVFDLFRISLLHNSAQEMFKGADHGARHLAVITTQISRSQENPILITGLKLLCNLFYGNTSHSMIAHRRESVLDAVLAHIDNTNNNVRLGLVTLLFNFSVDLIAEKENEGKIQVLSALMEFINAEGDMENQFRAFCAVGNILAGGGINSELVDISRQLGLDSAIGTKSCNGKANECKEELMTIFN